MQERQIQARFCLSRRDRPIAKARHSWRIEKQPSMRLECQRLRGIDDNLGRAVFVGDVYRSRAVLVVQPRIGADQLPALLVFVPSLLPPPPAALGAEDDGQGERERGEGASGARRRPQPLAQDAGPFLHKLGQRIFRRRPAQIRLCRHDLFPVDIGISIRCGCRTSSSKLQRRRSGSKQYRGRSSSPASARVGVCVAWQKKIKQVSALIVFASKAAAGKRHPQSASL